MLSSSAFEDAPEVDIMMSSSEESPLAEVELESPAKQEPPPSAPAVSVGLMAPEPLPASTGTPPEWKAELDQRVQTFRKRRSRTRGDSDPNLEFDFDEQPAEEAPPPASPPQPEPPSIVTSKIDIELASSSPPEAGQPEFDSVELAPHHVSEPVSEQDEQPLSQDSRPVEFVLDHPPDPAPAVTAPATVTIQLAPMTRRMAGGLIDGAVLIFSAGVFALIFWRAGGHASSNPLTLLVLSVVVIFHVMVYFGAFTAIISTTPGLLWMGIEVRSMWGGPPTLRQALWRALGCLVSASAMLLGFIWAVFDNESLTWHDRMSETYLAPADSTAHHEP